jgi:hypothetical protein
MDGQEILAQLQAQLSEDAVGKGGWNTLRFAIRSAFEFAQFLLTLPAGAAVSPNTEQVALRISQALENHYGVRDVASDSLSADDQDAFEESRYMNESTVAGAEGFVNLRRLASQVVNDTLPMPLRWRVYPGVAELKEEFLEHFDRLRSVDATASDRIMALLNTARLQMTFLANTFC